MSVTVDNTGLSAGALSATTITISSFVVAAGSDRCIYLAVSQYKNPDLQPTAVFNGSESFIVHDSVTIAEGAGTRRVTLFKLVNPTVTTANIVVSWSSAVGEAVCGATSWQGVDTSSPFSTAVKNPGDAAFSSIVVPNAAGDVVHDAISADASAVASVTPNQTQRWRAIAAASTTEGAGQSAVGAGTDITCTWSTINPDTGTGKFAHIGVAINQLLVAQDPDIIGRVNRSSVPPQVRLG